MIMMMNGHDWSGYRKRWLESNGSLLTDESTASATTLANRASFCNGAMRCTTLRVSDNGLLDLQQPINEVLDIAMVALEVICKVECLRLCVVVTHRCDGVPLTEGNREEDGVATRSSSSRIDLVE
jgi:hypothetical protein